MRLPRVSQYRLQLILIAFAAAAANRVEGGMYPIAPAGEHVHLSSDAFLQSVVEYTWQVDPVDAVGDNYMNHPGAFWTGGPQAGQYFIGLLSHPIGPEIAGYSVYLWETSGGPSHYGFSGPLITLGFWTGDQFIAESVTVPAFYQYTGVDTSYGYSVHSSVTTLESIVYETTFPINAVEITTWWEGHNQVTAVAVGVPEPSSLLLLCMGMVSISACGWAKMRLTQAADA